MNRRWWRPGAPWRRARTRSERRLQAAAVLAIVLGLLWAWPRRSRAGPPPTWPRSDILAAIRFVESSDRDDVPDGDGGKAIGPYQIHVEYWHDAMQFHPGLGGTWQDCRRREHAEAVIDAYMQRWAKDAWQVGDAETIARIHNGGPGGAGKESTLGYWERVRNRLP